MGNIINVAVQVLPKSDNGNEIEIIDEAIKVVIDSGIKYQVCPFETVMEGEYDQLLAIVKDMQAACYKAGAKQVIVNLKIQNAFDHDVSIEEKLEKYH